MQTVFLTGPMGWVPLLQVILGVEDVPAMKPARLSGAGITTGHLCFPKTVPSDGGDVAGGILKLDAEDAFARLGFFAAALGLVPIPRHVDGHARGASVTFLCSDTKETADWRLEDWQAIWGEVALEAAQEIMGYFGRLAPEELGWRMQMILARAAARCNARRDPAPTTLRSDTGADQVAVENVTADHEGFFLTRRYSLRHPQFDGGTSELLQREVFVASDAVIVLPYDAVRDRVLLVEQFRMGPFGRGDAHPWVLEPVAGRLDAGETREDAARRECEEEAGLTLQRLEHASSHYFSPGCSTEYYHCFVGLCDLPDDAGGFGGLETEHEDIRTHILPFEDAHAMIESGEANIGPLVLLLLWLETERGRLRQGV